MILLPFLRLRILETLAASAASVSKRFHWSELVFTFLLRYKVFKGFLFVVL